MVFAAILPPRVARWAVGGQDFPVAGSGTAAQSPSAQTPEQFATSRNSLVTSLPRSFGQSNSSKSGLGETPAVQTSRLVFRVKPSLSFTPSRETLLTAVLIRNSTPRFASFSRAYAPSF